jgi:hypothetical protein
MPAVQDVVGTLRTLNSQLVDDAIFAGQRLNVPGAESVSISEGPRQRYAAALERMTSQGSFARVTMTISQ